uniref:DUF4198 domain-containing protein n=1 Tax=Roseihalotalea indica TaxID=2867963 RepID=A0AA49GTQ8_9BACT|nr:hypothetical protein K4G66_09830 [Tunicatimonas sp. TK19036]
MTRTTLFLGLLFLPLLAAAQGYPEATIKNKHLQATLYLPDTEQGYYRSTRFDWSGVIGSLEYEGHQYFGNWKDQHSPTNPESISGPVEAFAPIGFEEAEAGAPFLIIGVGMLKKPSDEPYQFMAQYEIVNAGQWKVKKKKDQITFVQKLESEEGYAYEYTKTVRFIPGKPQMVLEHRLKNTGKKPLETTVYNHNFFIIDGEPTGPNIVTSFPFSVQAEGRGFGDIIVAQDSSLMYQRPLTDKENVYTDGLQGFGPTADDYDIRIENTKTGAGVHITADQPLLKFVYWACATTACPEPYLQVKAAPGEDFTWNITYEFFTTE